MLRSKLSLGTLQRALDARLALNLLLGFRERS